VLFEALLDKTTRLPKRFRVGKYDSDTYDTYSTSFEGIMITAIGAHAWAC